MRLCSALDMETRVELVCFGLSGAGWFCCLLARLLPVWSVTGAVGNSTVTLALYWDGVWLDWQHHSAPHCSFYQALLAQRHHLSGWGTLLSAALGLGLLGVALYPAGWLRYPRLVAFKAASGPVFVLSGLALLVAVSWAGAGSGWAMVLKRDRAGAIYSGWVGVALLEVGGGALSVLGYKAVRRRRAERGAEPSAHPGVQYPLQSPGQGTL